MPPRSGEELKEELESRQDSRIVRALEMVAPGTSLREGIDNILHARTGGLIVIGDADELAFLFSGGIKLDLDYSPELLYELSKMDGAIEFEGGATLHDVLTVLQRAELVTRMAVEIERFIVELGTEGRLIEMQLDETMTGVSADKAALVHDYLIDDSDHGFAVAIDQLV